jgi:NadR type nicotinamide-nucleotide adenylyltransferase
VIRVVVTGSECTGKTTLARQLAADFNTVFVQEFVREYYDRKEAPLTFDDVEPIARGVLQAEEMAAGAANELIVLDTDLLSTVIYSRHYYGDCPAWIVDESYRRAADLYLLLDIDVPWVADPQRDRGDAREAMHELFRGELERRRLPFVTIRGEWEERQRLAERAVRELLRSRSSASGG